MIFWSSSTSITGAEAVSRARRTRRFSAATRPSRASHAIESLEKLAELVRRAGRDDAREDAGGDLVRDFDRSPERSGHVPDEGHREDDLEQAEADQGPELHPARSGLDRGELRMRRVGDRGELVRELFARILELAEGLEERGQPKRDLIGRVECEVRHLLPARDVALEGGREVRGDLLDLRVEGERGVLLQVASEARGMCGELFAGLEDGLAIAVAGAEDRGQDVRSDRVVHHVAVGVVAERRLDHRLGRTFRRGESLHVEAHARDREGADEPGAGEEQEFLPDVHRVSTSVCDGARSPARIRCPLLGGRTAIDLNGIRRFCSRAEARGADAAFDRRYASVCRSPERRDAPPGFVGARFGRLPGGRDRAVVGKPDAGLCDRGRGASLAVSRAPG
jgi:hypothetical protein